MATAHKLNSTLQNRLRLLGVVSVLVILAAAALPPIAQPHDYHTFADQRTFFGIPNFMNVTSNFALLLSGLAGLIYLRHQSGHTHECNRKMFRTPVEIQPYRIFFLSIVMTALGSAYYHLTPDHTTLFWDRLPVAIAVMALLAAVLGERASPQLGARMLPILVLMGAASVIYWRWSEQQGAGNLNYYIVIQFYSLLLIVLLSLMLPTVYTHGSTIPKAIGFYALAKVAETFDQQIFAFGQIISGHTLKHLIAALTIWWVAHMLRERSSTIERRFDDSHINHSMNM